MLALHNDKVDQTQEVASVTVVSCQVASKWYSGITYSGIKWHHSDIVASVTVGILWCQTNILWWHYASRKEILAQKKVILNAIHGVCGWLKPGGEDDFTSTRMLLMLFTDTADADRGFHFAHFWILTPSLPSLWRLLPHRRRFLWETTTWRFCVRERSRRREFLLSASSSFLSQLWTRLSRNFC